MEIIDTEYWEKRLLQEQEQESLYDSLSILSDTQRNIIVFRYVHGLTLRETAEKMGLSVEGVRRAEVKGLKQIGIYADSRDSIEDALLQYRLKQEMDKVPDQEMRDDTAKALAYKDFTGDEAQEVKYNNVFGQEQKTPEELLIENEDIDILQASLSMIPQKYREQVFDEKHLFNLLRDNYHWVKENSLRIKRAISGKNSCEPFTTGCIVLQTATEFAKTDEYLRANKDKLGLVLTSSRYCLWEKIEASLDDE